MSDPIDSNIQSPQIIIPETPKSNPFAEKSLGSQATNIVDSLEHVSDYGEALHSLANKSDANDEIAYMVQKDQDVRMRKYNGEDVDIDAVDNEHEERIRNIVDAVGWPKDHSDSHNLWLLVQHMDDTSFQESCLQKMIEGGASKADVAYLTDRIRVKKGQQQLYGTQYFTGEDGVRSLCDIENQEGVDKRRKEMGLMSLFEQESNQNRFAL